MSHSATFNSRADLEANEAGPGSTSYEAMSLEERSQRDAGRKVAIALITDSPIAKPGRDYTVSISGHATTRPIPKGEHSYDSLCIHISQNAIVRPVEVVEETAPPDPAGESEEEPAPTS